MIRTNYRRDYTPNHRRIFIAAIHRARREMGLPDAVQRMQGVMLKDWLIALSKLGPGTSSLVPPKELVCHHLWVIQRDAKAKDKHSMTAEWAEQIRMKLACQGGAHLLTYERFLITKAVDSVVDPRVPVDIDLWLDDPDLPHVLEEYRFNDAPSEYCDDVEKLIKKLEGLEKQKFLQSRSEQERLHDFFFGRRRR